MSFIAGKNIINYESAVDNTSWNTAVSVASYSTYPQYKSLEYYPEIICAAGTNRWYIGIGGSTFQHYITSGVESYDVANINSSVSYISLGNGIIPYPYNLSLDVALNGTKAIVAYGLLSPPVVSSFNFDSTYNLAFTSRPSGGNSWAILNSSITNVYVTNTANMVFTCNATHVHKYVANAYNLASLTYDSAIPIGTTTTNDLFFSSDGSRLYTIGSGNDRIYQYNLGTNWNISTASLYGSYSVSAIDSNPRGFCLSEDGLYAYFLGRTNGRLYRLELATAYDITTAAYSSNYFSIGTSNSLETGTRIKPTGTHIYYNNGYSAIEVHLPTPYSLIGASKTGANGVLTRRSRFAYGLTFSSDGTHMYSGADRNLDKINISTAWNLTTSSFQEVDESLITIPDSRLSASGDKISSARYGDSGKKLYIIGSRTLQYDLATPYNIGTATYNTYGSVGVAGVVANDFYVSSNRFITFSGTQLKSFILTKSWNVASAVSDTANNKTIYGQSAFITNGGNELLLANNYSIIKYTMNSTYVPATATYRSNNTGWYSEAPELTYTPRSLAFSSDGSNMYYLHTNTVRRYNLTNSWNIESSSFIASYPLGAEYTTLRIAYDGLNAFVGSDYDIKHIVLTAPYDFSSYTTTGTNFITNKSFYINNQGTKLFVLNTGVVTEYSLTNRWNVSSAVTTGHSYSLLNPSSSTDLIFSSTGSYLYHITANTSSLVNTVQRYKMGSKWDITTLSYDSSFVVKGMNMSVDGLYFKPYGNEYYVMDTRSRSIYNLKV